jgi:cytochrome c553
MKKFVLSLVCGVVVLGLGANAAQAVPAFDKEFKAMYVKKDSSDPAEKAFAEAAAKAKCLVCHGKNADGKEDKKVRNAYGEALDKLLDKKADIKNKEKIVKSLEEFGKMHSDPDDDISTTFGDLIKEGKLPGGEIK